MATGGRVERAARAGARAASVVVPFPRERAGGTPPRERLDLVRLVPSGRSLLIAFAIVAAALGTYWAGRASSVFSVDRITVEGAPPDVARQVRRTLADTRGESLLAVDLDAAVAAVQALPTVRSAELDRSFPHVLAITVVPERPVAVLRRGARSWLVSARGRVMAGVERRAHRRLPRIWIGRGVALEPGAVVPDEIRSAVAAVAPLASTGARLQIVGVNAARDDLTLKLRSGLLLRLGDGTQLSLKLAIASRLIRLVEAGTVVVDVSVPERPVASTTLDSQVEVETIGSTNP